MNTNRSHVAAILFIAPSLLIGGCQPSAHLDSLLSENRRAAGTMVTKVAKALPLLDEPMIDGEGRIQNLFPSNTNREQLFYAFGDVLDLDRDEAGHPSANLFLSPEVGWLVLPLKLRESSELEIQRATLLKRGFTFDDLSDSSRHLKFSAGALAISDLFENSSLPLIIDQSRVSYPAFISQFVLSARGLEALWMVKEKNLELDSVFKVEFCRTIRGLSTEVGGEHLPVEREFCLPLKNLNEVLDGAIDS